MTENPADFIPIWMIMSAAFGFIVGEAFGDSSRHRKCLQQANEELRDRLQEATTDTEPIHRALKQQRGVINDIHSRLVAVSKGLEKRLS
jgi:hypothetical protein